MCLYFYHILNYKPPVQLCRALIPEPFLTRCFWHILTYSPHAFRLFLTHLVYHLVFHNVVKKIPIVTASFNTWSYWWWRWLFLFFFINMVTRRLSYRFELSRYGRTRFRFSNGKRMYYEKMGMKNTILYCL